MRSSLLTPTDRLAVGDLISRSQQWLDAGRIDELVDDLFVPDGDGRPWADFGFARWVGVDELKAGYRTSMARFEAAMHACANLTVDRDGDDVVARYYVAGWHWLAESTAAGPDRGADFLVLGSIEDRVVSHRGEWRLATRTLERVGPGVAAGALPSWLGGLGEA